MIDNCFLMQLPPSLQIAEGLDLLNNLQYILYSLFKYAIEVRHHSWFNELFYNYLKERNYCLVWSQQYSLITPPIITADFVYLRLIRDRRIDERDSGQIKKLGQKKCICGCLYSKTYKRIKQYNKSTNILTTSNLLSTCFYYYCYYRQSIIFHI
jgi:uncharacterized protein YecE (DUF72 family)